jgi:hypothetical protein
MLSETPAPISEKRRFGCLFALRRVAGLQKGGPSVQRNGYRLQKGGPAPQKLVRVAVTPKEGPNVQRNGDSKRENLPPRISSQDDDLYRCFLVDCNCNQQVEGAGEGRRTASAVSR